MPLGISNDSYSKRERDARKKMEKTLIKAFVGTEISWTYGGGIRQSGE
jgi:hypothetical protein